MRWNGKENQLAGVIRRLIHSVSPVWCDKWPITTRLSRCAHVYTAAVAGLKNLKYHSSRSCWKPKEEEKQERARPAMSIYKTKSQFNISIRCTMIYGTIEKSHAYHYRSWSLLYIPPAYISYTFFIYTLHKHLVIGGAFHESNHHPRLSCYSIALCWTYAPNDWILREFQGWKDEGRRGAAAGLLNALADGWGGWRHKTLHASPAKCCFLIVGRREKRREGKKRVSQWRFN